MDDIEDYELDDFPLDFAWSRGCMTGVLPDGRQVFLIPHDRSESVLVFSPEGEFAETRTVDRPDLSDLKTSEERIERSMKISVERLTAMGAVEGPIRVRGFGVSDPVYVGLSLYPFYFDELEGIGNTPEEAQAVRQDWMDRGCYVLHLTGVDYWVDGQGFPEKA